jgi:hypothetical protein
MSKLLMTTAAAGILAIAAFSPAAAAGNQRADGARNTEVTQWEFSDHRRRYRHRHRYVRRYWAPGPYYYGRPYYAPYYAYAPRYRPFGYPWGYPGMGFGIGFGW